MVRLAWGSNLDPALRILPENFTHPPPLRKPRQPRGSHAHTIIGLRSTFCLLEEKKGQYRIRVLPPRRETVAHDLLRFTG
jgi:hypothetical protein